MSDLHPLFLLNMTLSYLLGYLLPLLGEGFSLIAIFGSIFPAVMKNDRVRVTFLMLFFSVGSVRGFFNGPSLPDYSFAGEKKTVRFSGEVLRVNQAGPLVNLTIKGGVAQEVYGEKESKVISRFSVYFFGKAKWFSGRIGNWVIGIGRLESLTLGGEMPLYSLYAILDGSPYKVNTQRRKILFFGKAQRKSTRERLTSRIASVFHQLGTYEMGRDFLTTILTGEKIYKSELRRVLVDTGLAHLLAISGLHIGVAVLLFVAFSRFFLLLIYRAGMVFDVNLPSFIAGSVAALAYAYISGMAVTVARAYSMMVFTAFSGRKCDRCSIFTPISFAFFIIVLSEPSQVASVSFVYSFLITFYLVILLGGKTGLKENKVRLNVVISLTAYCVSVPLSAYFFQCASLFGFLYNLVFVPLFIPLIALSLGWAFLYISGLFFLKPVGKGLVVITDYLLRAVRWCTDFTGPASQIIRPNIIYLLCFFLALTCIFFLCLKVESADKLL